MFDQAIAASRGKQILRRTPSAPLRGSAELFRGSHIRCDIPFFTEGIELLNFQRLGTIHIPRVRSGSDPSCTIGRSGGAHISSARSHNNLYDTNQSEDSSSSSTLSSATQSPTNSPPRNSLLGRADDSPIRTSPEPVSFENMCRETSQNGIVSSVFLVLLKWEFLVNFCLIFIRFGKRSLNSLVMLMIFLKEI